MLDVIDTTLAWFHDDAVDFKKFEKVVLDDKPGTKVL